MHLQEIEIEIEIEISSSRHRLISLIRQYLRKKNE